MKDIVVRNLKVDFYTSGGAVRAVDDVNAVFQASYITGVIGESGSGKSVLGMSIVRLLPGGTGMEGSILFRGEDLLKLNDGRMRKIRGKEIALIPQSPSESMNPVLTIGTQAAEGIRLHQNPGRTEAYARIRSLLYALGFSEPGESMKQYPFQLSGGMKQRVLAVMGIACEPSWIIADEPTKGLDAALRNQVYHQLKRIAGDSAGGMIVITHDLKLAEKLCDRILVLYAGQVVEEGWCGAVLRQPRHPYTVGLMASLPSRGMHSMKGMSPGSDEEVPGCKFYPRCSCSLPECSAGRPPLFENADGREVRCFRYAEGGGSDQKFP